MAGSKRIKGITVEIDGNTTGLSDALKSVNKQLNTTSSSLKDVNKLLKLDPKNVELLHQKQKLLADAIDASKQKISQLKEAQKQIGDQIKREGVGQEQYDLLTREIADAEANLKTLEKQAKESASAVGSYLQAVGSEIKKAGDKIAGVGKDLTTKVTVPLAAAGTVAATKFAEVDKTMQLVNKTMNNTEEQADLINKAMKDAASESVFGMSDAATAALNFARAGLSAEQAAAALAPAMNLAAGEGGNLDVVSAGLVATINGFGGSFDDAAAYADVFANACNNSALDVDSLSSAMSEAAPIFAAAGYSVEDAALYMGIMANAGIPASEAANSLSTGFARLVSPAKEGASKLKELGVEVVNADGSMKDSLTIQKDLHDAFGELSESEQIAAASAIFGKNQMDKWLALINTAPEDVTALSGAIGENGTTLEMSTAMMEGFGGSIEKLKSSTDVLVTSMGESLAPILQQIIDKVQAVVDWFNGLDESQQTTIVTILAVVAAIGPLLLIFGKVISTIGSIISIGGTLITFLSGLTLTTGLVGLAIGTLIAIGVTLYKNWDQVCAAAARAKQNLLDAFNAVRDGVGSAMNTAKEKVSSAIDSIKGFFERFKPHFKMPHVTITGEFSLVPPRIPRFSVDWYAKAMDRGVIFRQPTLFGVNAKGQPMGAGEAGAEALVGVNSLQSMIETAVSRASVNNTYGATTINVYGAPGQDVNELADVIEERIAFNVRRRANAW